MADGAAPASEPSPKKAKGTSADPLAELAFDIDDEEDAVAASAISRPSDLIVVKIQGRRWTLKRGAAARFSLTLRSMISCADDNEEEENETNRGKPAAPLAVTLDPPIDVDLDAADRIFGYFAHFFDSPLSGASLRESYVQLADAEKPFFFLNAAHIDDKLIAQLRLADYLDARVITRCIAKYLLTKTISFSRTQMVAFLGRSEDFTPAQYEEFRKYTPEFSVPQP